MLIDKIKLKTPNSNDYPFNLELFKKDIELNTNASVTFIVGENGSGKSSIYWSLYTLFEAALKKDKSDIEKYFKHHTEHEQ